jgi:hypothetical protein
MSQHLHAQYIYIFRLRDSFEEHLLSDMFEFQTRASIQPQHKAEGRVKEGSSPQCSGSPCQPKGLDDATEPDKASDFIGCTPFSAKRYWQSPTVGRRLHPKRLGSFVGDSMMQGFGPQPFEETTTWTCKRGCKKEICTMTYLTLTLARLPALTGTWKGHSLNPKPTSCTWFLFFPLFP